MHKETVLENLKFPEGPVVMRPGTVAYCEEFASCVSIYNGSSTEVYSNTGGSPNGATLGSDGCLYIAQNGGVIGTWHADVQNEPGVQRIDTDGKCTMLCTHIGNEPLLAPNDICFGPDGDLYFSDPAHGYDPDNRAEDSRIYRIAAGAREDDSLVARLAPVYCNGLAFTPGGELVWVESYDRRVLVLRDGAPHLLCQLPEYHVPDGFAIADDGRFFIATLFSKGITVVSPDGEVLNHIPLGDDSCPTNCAFDGSTLWITDAGPFTSSLKMGRLWRVETDARGLPLYTGSVSGLGAAS